ncbi:glycoside hydrolase family 2 protein [Flavobacterium saccharophilum]|uniref:beta-galactosidase n=1 Tax=Flavobacterium saccharophilum TaxID=29534 RepID=A0A1M7IKU1_9FLAO|nr:glycoside hydrolase family 2 TIM barrel-domain containing protein [Flavobacterium saccharophilum]SHM41213.1 Beta galactosidase small chain [Flavobacterium saccharophilum]
MKKIFVFLLCAVMAFAVNAQQFIAEGRKALAVIPSQTSGVPKAKISLNGLWEINMNPGNEVWKNDSGNWQKIQVPGEPAMQGFKVENDKEFFYKTTVNVSASAKNKTTIIRFNGVYSYARVFVNGHFVREHFGGFTAWDADISAFVEPGKPAIVYVGVTDRADDISYASGYAFHPIGGILREVQLLVVPNDYINRFYVQTDFENDFKEAKLSLTVAKSKAKGNSKIKFQLYDAGGKAVLNQPQTFDLANNGEGKFSVTFANPILWNQEQPYLYTLKAELISAGKSEEKIEQKIGFRKVVVDGKRVLVNGQPIKLRGGCRHDMHPLLGRSTNRYYDSLDVAMAKKANLNFIRTSHYPPSQDFLEFADKYGIYVQEETAICFVNDWREGVYKKLGETSNDPAFTSRYLGQLSEMIDHDRNHAAVIMWSIGNESDYGINFQKEYEFVKSVDLSRPVSWSWPATAFKENKRCFDIAVAHYPDYKGKDEENFGLAIKNMEHESLPLLSDEWAHVACYNTTLLKADPNVKDFWGQSLDLMWANRFDVPGNLGGAIWGMTDETFHLKDTVTGYGPWGFIDVWRREKTEFWNTKKAYSPIRVLKTKFESTEVDAYLNVPVKNRFNHISLDQIKLKITINGKSFDQPMPALKPHEEGVIKVAISDTNSPVLLQFYDAQNNLIDEEQLTFNKPITLQVKTLKLKWNIKKTDKVVELESQGLKVKLDAVTGELLSSEMSGEKVVTGAARVMVNKPKQPEAFKETPGIYSGEYKIKSATINTDDKSLVTVTSEGTIDDYPVKMTTVYQADGTINIEYEVENVPEYTWQIGVALPVADTFETIEWKRKGYWSTYPSNHVSANEGKAKRFSDIKETYRVQPVYDVSQGMYDYYLKNSIDPVKANMKGTEMYRGTKENILSVDLTSGNKKIEVISNGLQAAKMNILESGQQELLIMDKSDYWSLSWGNFAGTKNNSKSLKGRAVVKLVQKK